MHQNALSSLLVSNLVHIKINTSVPTTHYNKIQSRVAERLKLDEIQIIIGLRELNHLRAAVMLVLAMACIMLHVGVPSNERHGLKADAKEFVRSCLAYFGICLGQMDPKSLAAGLRIKSFSYQLTSQRYTAGLVCAQIKASLWFSLTPSLGPCCSGGKLSQSQGNFSIRSFRSFILSDLFLFSFSLDINVARYNVQQAPVASSMSVSVCACEIMHPLPNRIMISINHGAFVILCSKPDLLHPIHQLSEVV